MLANNGQALCWKSSAAMPFSDTNADCALPLEHTSPKLHKWHEHISVSTA